MKLYYFIICLILSSISLANAAVMRVSAVGEVKAKPDMTSFEFGVVSKDPNPQQALDANSKATNKILEALHKDNIQEQDIQTSSLLLYQDQNQDKKAQTIYAAENNIVVRVKNLKNLSTIYKDIIVSGANQTSNLVYTNQNTSAIYNEARIRAVHNAIEKAKLLAKAANLKLGDITNIESYANNGNPGPLARQAMAIGAESATPIEQGLINYSAEVTITFNLIK